MVPTVTFVLHDGSERQVDVETDQPLMQAAVEASVPGIDGDCGGEAACGTCHIIVDEEWCSALGPATAIEEEMLAINPERSACSRLSCQVQMRSEWGGLRVHVPEFQM